MYDEVGGALGVLLRTMFMAPSSWPPGSMETERAESIAEGAMNGMSPWRLMTTSWRRSLHGAARKTETPAADRGEAADPALDERLDNELRDLD